MARAMTGSLCCGVAALAASSATGGGIATVAASCSAGSAGPARSTRAG
jgi:hypothetical protein